MRISDGNMSFLTPERKKILLFGLLIGQVMLCFCYGFLPAGRDAFPLFSMLYLGQFLAFALSIWFLTSTPISWMWILVAAALGRLVLLFSYPVLEDDFWRYLWDGRVLAHGINPYSYKPLDHALDFLDTGYRHQIGWKQYGTIYPPVSIFVFSLAHLLRPDSLLALKVILVGFDLATGVVVAGWMRAKNISTKWSLLYFLNPLVLKEIANSGHLDSIAVFFSVAAGFYLDKGQRKIEGTRTKFAAWLFLAIAIASKLYPVVLVPLFFKLSGRGRWRCACGFTLMLLFLYAPVFLAGTSGLSGTEAFARHWIFNAGPYRVLQKGSELLLHGFTESHEWAALLLKDDLLAKLVGGAMATIFIGYRALRATAKTEVSTEITLALGTLLLLSPVVNAWYLLWFLPFACIIGSVPWLAFSFLVVASYSWWYSPELAFYLRWTEYSVFFVLLVIFRRAATLEQKVKAYKENELEAVIGTTDEKLQAEPPFGIS